MVLASGSLCLLTDTVDGKRNKQHRSFNNNFTVMLKTALLTYSVADSCWLKLIGKSLDLWLSMDTQLCEVEFECSCLVLKEMDNTKKVAREFYRLQSLTGKW